MKKRPARKAFALLILLLLVGCHDANQGDRGGSTTETWAEQAGTEQLQEDTLPGGDAPSENAAPPRKEPIVLEYLNATELLPGVWGGGQPTREQLRAAAASGVRTVVNMRLMTEQGAWDEREFVESLGMRYLHMPIEGSAGVTSGNAVALSGITSDEGTHPLMLHCASGRRINALMALMPAQKTDPR